MKEYIKNSNGFSEEKITSLLAGHFSDCTVQEQKFINGRFIVVKRSAFMGAIVKFRPKKGDMFVEGHVPSVWLRILLIGLPIGVAAAFFGALGAGVSALIVFLILGNIGKSMKQDVTMFLKQEIKEELI